MAILPFHLLEATPDLQFLGLGVPDAIITRLSNVRQIRVRSTSAILRYESESPDVATAGRALAADYVMTGTVQRAAERLRVSVQLVRVRDTVSLWGDHYDLAREDLLELQDSIARQVAVALQLQMTAVERARLYRRYTAKADAYEAYLRGRSHLARSTKEATLAAVAAFQDALRLDTTYALALAGLAMASADMHLRYASGDEVKAWGERATREAVRALTLDSNLAESHQALAAIYRKTDFDWDRTIEESGRALELNPSLDLPHYFRAAAFYHIGLLDEAEHEVLAGRRSGAENPADALRSEGVIAFLGGRYGEATNILEELRREDSYALADHYLAQAYFYAGDEARADSILNEAIATNSAPLVARAQAGLASFLAARGQTEPARSLLRATIGGPYMDHHVAFSIGAAYAQLGDTTLAIKWLDQARHSGFPCAVWFERDPLLRPLRGVPGFERLLAELRAGAAAARARYGSSPERAG